MTLQQLKYVYMVEKYGSFSKAAQKLYVSQPGVSNLVQALEKELGITIFDRSSTGITITSDGRELLKLGNKLLRDADYIDEYFHLDAQKKKPSFFVSSQHYDFVVKAFESFMKCIDAERYTLGLNQTQTSTVIDDVRKQYSNLGVIFMSDINRQQIERTLSDNNLEHYKIASTKPHIFVSMKHPLANKKLVKIEELMDYPCLVYEQNLESPGFFSEEMTLPDFYPKKVVYISDLYVSTSLMRECDAYDVGTGIISKRLARNLACVPIDTDDVVDICWIVIKGKKLDALEEVFLKNLEKQIENSTINAK